jgi:hypothetical protein
VSVTVDPAGITTSPRASLTSPLTVARSVSPALLVRDESASCMVASTRVPLASERPVRAALPGRSPSVRLGRLPAVRLGRLSSVRLGRLSAVRLGRLSAVRLGRLSAMLLGWLPAVLLGWLLAVASWFGSSFAAPPVHATKPNASIPVRSDLDICAPSCFREEGEFLAHLGNE